MQNGLEAEKFIDSRHKQLESGRINQDSTAACLEFQINAVQQHIVQNTIHQPFRFPTPYMR